MRKVLILGGLGVIGRLLSERLDRRYDITIADIKAPWHSASDLHCATRRVDVSDLVQVRANIEAGTDTIIDLVAMPRVSPIVDASTFALMTDTYSIGFYNVLLSATECGVRRVIVASSNHVTGMSESASVPTEAIDVRTYPEPDSVYGVLKLAQEGLARLFAAAGKLSVVSLRIGTVVEDEVATLQANHRARRTLLSRVDCAHLFECAIEADIMYGIYYGVSDNPGRPWSIKEAQVELGYRPQVNSSSILRG